MTKAVFLDRDGTISEEVNYCRRAEDLHLIPLVTEAVNLLNRSGFKVIVVTNQSGIAREYFTLETLEQIHQKMQDELAIGNAKVNAIYHCPHHPDDGCECRKPATGLLRKASHDFNVNLEASYMVGDRQTDVETGKAAGCKTVLVATGPDWENGVSSHPDYIADNLMSAARWIVSDSICQEFGNLLHTPAKS